MAFLLKKSYLVNKKHMRHFSFILAFILHFIALGQSNTSPVIQDAFNSYRLNDYFEDIINMKKNRNSEKLDMSKISGSQYFNDSFVLGKIYVQNKEIEKPFSLRYNAFNDQIETTNGVEIDALIRNRTISALIGKDKFIFKLYNENGITKNGYLIELFKGDNIILLKQLSKKLKEGKQARTPHTTSVPPKLVDEINYFLLINNEVTNKISLKKKLFLKLFESSYQKNITQFIKQHKLNLKKTEDLIRIFEYYDGLLGNNS